MKIPDTIKKISPFWLLIIGLGFLLWVPHLLSLGMFMDGIFDAVTAENLYKGASTFWAPQDIQYTHPEAWGSPPLATYILALCYKVLGNHYAVERIYSFACAILQIGLIALLWRTLFTDNENLKAFAWLPCLMWLMSPLIGWSYSNNLLENTMSLFTSAALILTTRYVVLQRQTLLSALSIALLLLLGFITKGPVALFPLAMPVLMIGYTTQFEVRRALIFNGLQILLFAGCFILLFSFTQPADFLHHYYDVQLKKAFMPDANAVSDTGQIFIELILATSVFIAIALLRILMRKVLTEENYASRKVALRMLLLGLCGSVPIALSAKQRGFYLLPAMIPLAIAAGAYLVPLAAWAEKQLNHFKLHKIIKWASAGMVMLAIILCLINRGAIIRDNDMLTDIRSTNALLHNEPVIRADWRFYGEWSLRAYWLRLYGTKLCMPDEIAPTHYYITKPNMSGDKLPANATKIFAGKTFDLYHL